MYTNPQRRSDVAVQELRREAGRYIRSLREGRGLSQRQLADLIGTEYYTFISQLRPVVGVFRRTSMRRGQMRWGSISANSSSISCGFMTHSPLQSCSPTARRLLPRLLVPVWWR